MIERRAALLGQLGRCRARAGSSTNLTIVLIAALIGWLTVSPAAAKESTGLSLASDPIAWALDGYSGIVMVEPAGLPGWRISAEFFSLTFPEAVVNLSESNREGAWSREVTGSGVIYLDHHPSADGAGWHYGGAVNLMFSRVTRDGISGEGRLTSLELLSRGGYRWFPIQGMGFFVNPWLGLGALFVVDEPEKVGGERFEEMPVQLLGTLHIGWRL